MPNRIALVVEVDLDRTPGWGNKAADWVKYLQHLVPAHYNPKVRLQGPVDKRTLESMTMQELGDLVVG